LTSFENASRSKKTVITFLQIISSEDNLMLNASPVTHNTSNTTVSPWRSVGVWMAVFLVIYLFFNVFRAVQNPAEFAVTFGVPFTNPEGTDTAFVFVYAIRTLFLALFGLVLILSMKWEMLALYILIAAVIPLGDAAIVATHGGATSIIIRHILIAAFLLLNWFLLQRWARKAAEGKPRSI
jgi:hypothetical protein